MKVSMIIHSLLSGGATRALDGLSHPNGDNALAGFASPFEREATDVAPYRVISLEY